MSLPRGLYSRETFTEGSKWRTADYNTWSIFRAWSFECGRVISTRICLKQLA